MERASGILYAALSSSTFGLAPLFTLLLLGLGYSSFEVLSYRWGVASLFRCPGAARRAQFPPLMAGIDGRYFPEPFPRRHVAEPGHRLPAYRQRRRVDHSFHVSAGRRPGHDVLLPRKKAPYGSLRPSACPSSAPCSFRWATSISPGEYHAGHGLGRRFGRLYGGYIVGVRKSRAVGGSTPRC